MTVALQEKARGSEERSPTLVKAMQGRRSFFLTGKLSSSLVPTCITSVLGGRADRVRALTSTIAGSLAIRKIEV